MATVQQTPQGVIASLAVAQPGISSVLSKLPQTVRRGGKTYSAKDAKTPDHQAWYIAAVAQSNPTAVFSAAKGIKASGFDFFDFDAEGEEQTARDEKQAAYAELRRAKAAVTTLKAQVASADREIANANADVKRSGHVDAGSILTLGVSNSMGKAKALDRLRKAQDKKADLESQLGTEQGNVQKAQADYNAASKRLDEALQAKRDEEAQRRAVALQAQQDAAAQAQAQAQYAQQAQAAQQRAAEWTGTVINGTAEPYQGSSSGASNVMSGPSGDWSQWGDGLNWDDMANTYGGEQFGLEMLDAQDEPIPPRPFNVEVDDMPPSPYERHVFYCDCPAFECGGTCIQQKGPEVYGFDFSIITTILTVILAIAPTILAAISPPPAVEDKPAETTTPEAASSSGGSDSSGLLLVAVALALAAGGG